MGEGPRVKCARRRVLANGPRGRMASAASSRAGKGRRALPEVPYASVLGAGAIRSLLAGPNGDAVQNVLFVLRQAAHDPARAKAAPLPRRDGISFGKSSARSPSGGVSVIGLLGLDPGLCLGMEVCVRPRTLPATLFL